MSNPRPIEFDTKVFGPVDDYFPDDADEGRTVEAPAPAPAINGNGKSGPAIASPLAWIDLSKWDGQPVPRRKWAIHDRVPLNQAGLFSGEGGTGKSIIEITKNIAHVTGKDWLGSMPEPGPAFYLGAEDDVDELHIRIAAIAAHYGTTFKELAGGGLHVLCLLGQDATLCAPTRSGKVEPTDLYRWIYEAAGDIKPKNISIDTLSRAFAGNEIDRPQVYAFASHMQALAMVAGGSVTVLSHPSLHGVASGSGISGSTAWHGAFRFRQYLKGAKPSDGEQPDGDLRELEFKKNQYGPLGETVVLRYRNGLFVPEAGMSNLDKFSREAKAAEVFLNLLKRLGGEGRNVGDKPNSPTYAPATFARENEAKQVQLRKPDFEAAMRRLFADGKIHVETYGRPSRPYSRLAIK
jgi:RecA-family ATPase